MEKVKNVFSISELGGAVAERPEHWTKHNGIELTAKYHTEIKR